MRSIIAVGIVVTIGLFGGAVAAERDANDPADTRLSQSERLEALVERMKLEQRGIVTMQAAFRQKTSSEMLLAPEEAEGVFYYHAPDRVRWEYHSPTPKVILITGDQLLTWYQDLGRAELRHVGRYSDAVFKYLGASGSLEALRDYFDLTVTWPGTSDDPYRVRLQPKYARVERRLKQMSIAIDGRLFMPTELKYLEPQGDETEYEFSDFRINEEIDDGRFDVKLPAGVEVRVVSESGS